MHFINKTARAAHQHYTTKDTGEHIFIARRWSVRQRVKNSRPICNARPPLYALAGIILIDNLEREGTGTGHHQRQAQTHTQKQREFFIRASLCADK
jgi:hypothetical protein